MLRRIKCCLVSLLTVLWGGLVFAQPTAVGVITGPFGSSSATMGRDIMQEVSPLEVNVFLGRGSAQNLDDLLDLPTVDFAFVNTDVIANLTLTDPTHPALSKLGYLAKVANAELHVLVRRGSNLKTIYDLENRKVSFGNLGSGTALTSRLILRVLNIKSQGYYLPPLTGLDALKTKKIDALFMVGAAPIPLLQNLNLTDAYSLLPVPYSARLKGVYDPARLTRADYPALIKPTTITGISVPVALAGRLPDTPATRRDKAAKTFARALFAAMPNFQKKPHHPKWAELDLAARIPGWTRIAP